MYGISRSRYLHSPLGKEHKITAMFFCLFILVSVINNISVCLFFQEYRTDEKRNFVESSDNDCRINGIENLLISRESICPNN